MLTMVLVILLVLAIGGGGWGWRAGWGYMGWSPVGIILLICLVLWFTGYIHPGHGFR